MSGDIVARKITGPRNSLSWLSHGLRGTGAEADVYTTSSSAPFVHNGQIIYAINEACWKHYDVVVINGIFHPALTRCILACRLQGIPLLLAPRGSFMRSAMTTRKLAYLGLLWPLLKDIPVHFLSEDEKRHSITTSRRFMVVPNGVNPQFHNLHPSYGGRKDYTTFGFMGRLDIRHKGLDFLLGAASRLASDRLPVEFLLCGPGNVAFTGFYEEWRRKSGKQDVVRVLPPAATFHDAGAFLSRIDYFVHPSRYEGLPQASMEAMAAGVPVIVSKACNLGAFLPLYNTALIHSPTCEGAYSSYRYASGVNTSEHAALAADVRAAARHNFDWDVVARRYRRLIEEIVLRARG